MTISIKLQLGIRNFIDYDLEKAVPGMGTITRVRCGVQFKTSGGWSRIRIGIVDTGGHTTVIQYAFWSNADVKLLGKHVLKGVVPKSGCEIPVKIGKISCQLVDELDNKSGDAEVRAYLAEVNTVPLIIGIRDLLENWHIELDIGKRIGFIEIEK